MINSQRKPETDLSKLGFFISTHIQIQVSHSQSITHQSPPIMATRGSRSEKVRRIFQQFDANHDGGLNREEMSALVVAVNPRVKFSDEQINAILDEVFRTYGEFIDAEKGLTSFIDRRYKDAAPQGAAFLIPDIFHALLSLSAGHFRFRRHAGRFVSMVPGCVRSSGRPVRFREAGSFGPRRVASSGAARTAQASEGAAAEAAGYRHLYPTPSEHADRPDRAVRGYRRGVARTATQGR